MITFLQKIIANPGRWDFKKEFKFFLCLTHHGENCDISEGDNSEYGYDPGWSG